MSGLYAYPLDLVDEADAAALLMHLAADHIWSEYIGGMNYPRGAAPTLGPWVSRFALRIHGQADRLSAARRRAVTPLDGPR